MSTLKITRIAHACVLIDFDGVSILTDPWFSERPGYYRGEPLGIPLSGLPRLDGVLVSHAHYDHYDMNAFQAYYDKAVPLVVKRGSAKQARTAGFTRVSELDPWETIKLGPVKITAAPAKHSVPENTYLLEAGGFTVFFGADTLLIPELSEVALRYSRIDVALLAVNGLAIRPLLNHKVVMSAQDAAKLCSILKPRIAVPIHYAYTAGPIRDRLLLKYNGSPEEFSQAAALWSPETKVCMLAPGKPLRLES